MRAQPEQQADHASAAVPASTVRVRKGWSGDAVADIAMTGAVLVAGSLVHWQFESHTSLIQALATPAAPLLGTLILLWALCAAIHCYRRRSALILVTAAVMLSPALLQLPYLYLCSEGHCA